MKVLILFEPAFSGDPLDAVWIIDSPHNRSWFAAQVERIDPNSAVFNPMSEPLDILENVFLHHPTWTEIVVRGTDFTADLAHSLKSDAVVRDQDANGFKLAKAE